MRNTLSSQITSEDNIAIFTLQPSFEAHYQPAVTVETTVTSLPTPLLNFVLRQRTICSLETNLNSTGRTLCYQNLCSTMQTTLKKQFSQESHTGFKNRKGKQ